jgi:hypothetical protein
MPIDCELTFAFPEPLEVRLGNRTQQVVTKAAAAIAADARRRIRLPPKSGHVYRTGPQPLPHQASAPGESPANWRGILAPDEAQTLIGSIRYKPSPLAEGIAEAVAEVGAQHGAPLEYGTRFIAPRPFLAPAAAEVGPLFTAWMIAAIDLVTPILPLPEPDAEA